MPERKTGVVAKWLNHKGIGFITPEGAEEDVLVHFEQIKQNTEDGFKSLAQGSKVEFELQQDPKNSEKFVAVNVTGENGEDCEPKKKGQGKGKGKGKKGKGKKSKDDKSGDEEQKEE